MSDDADRHIDERERDRSHAEDAREEYTDYRETDADRPDPDDEAVREAELQPGSPDHDGPGSDGHEADGEEPGPPEADEQGGGAPGRR